MKGFFRYISFKRSVALCNLFSLSVTTATSKSTNCNFIQYVPSNMHSSMTCFLLLWLNHHMMTSSNENIFRVTGPLCGEFTSHRLIPDKRPVTRRFDAFFDLRLNKRLIKQSRGWWFETPSHPLWRHSNVVLIDSFDTVMHIFYSCFTGSEATSWLPQRQWNKLPNHEKTQQCGDKCVRVVCDVLSNHYSGLMASAMASKITGISIVSCNICSDADWRKHESSASLNFVEGNPSVTGGLPSQRASDAVNVSIQWTIEMLVIWASFGNSLWRHYNAKSVASVAWQPPISPLNNERQHDDLYLALIVLYHQHNNFDVLSRVVSLKHWNVIFMKIPSASQYVSSKWRHRPLGKHFWCSSNWLHFFVNVFQIENNK